MQSQKNRKRNYKKLWNRNKYYFLMVLPAVISVFIFCYIPMYGVLIAFQDYKIGHSILGNEWVGLKHFAEYFNSLYFGRTLRNTFLLGLYSVLWGFPIPVIFAVFLNEIRNRHAKKVIQTVSYFPHFISVVVLVGMVKNFLDPDTGIVNVLIRALRLLCQLYERERVVPDDLCGIRRVAGLWMELHYHSVGAQFPGSHHV